MYEYEIRLFVGFDILLWAKQGANRQIDKNDLGACQTKSKVTYSLWCPPVLTKYQAGFKYFMDI